MGAHRAFYVTQGSLSVWQDGKERQAEPLTFADNDAGLRAFDAYLADSREHVSFVVIDVIEEEFALERIPKLGLRDRGSLIRRRLQRKFPRTPYRMPLYQGVASPGENEAAVVHCAITNHELLDPWLQVMQRHEVPLTGVFSVPLMAPQLLAKLHKPSGPVMLITQHQGHKLRQVFMHDGHVRSARLSQSPPMADDGYPQFVITEIGRSRRYLERNRMLSGMQQLDVYIITEPKLAERVLAEAQSDSPLKMHFIKPQTAAKHVGLQAPPAADRLESLFLAMAAQRRPKRSYAVSGESRFWYMRRLRHAVIGASVATAAVCSVLSALYFSDAWFLKARSAEIETQLVQLTETFRRENEQFDPIKADSHEMKLAVDTGDFILANRLPVPWVMQQLGLVMGNYDDVQILNLGWAAEAPAPEAPARQARPGESLPVPVPAITTVTADITADITPFDGNMRRAFARIDALAADLRERTAFSDVSVVAYPLDPRPQSALAGEIVKNGTVEAARFRLRLRYPVQPEAASDVEMNNDSV